jgi:hypothetical protein
MAVPMTLAEARTQAAQLLDDPNNRRWSSAQIDFALQSGVSRCLQDYVANGGERFDTEQTGTSSASDGTLALSSYKPLIIKSVTMDTGDTFIPLRAVTKREKFRADTTARDLVILYVRDYELPSTTTHALVGNGATSANTWAAFDNWCVARAALQLAVKDDKLSDALAVLETDLRASCLARPNNPVAMEWPRPSAASRAYSNLRWSWLPSGQQLQVCTGGGVLW